MQNKERELFSHQQLALLQLLCILGSPALRYPAADPYAAYPT